MEAIALPFVVAATAFGLDIEWPYLAVVVKLHVPTDSALIHPTRLLYHIDQTHGNVFVHTNFYINFYYFSNIIFYS